MYCTTRTNCPVIMSPNMTIVFNFIDMPCIAEDAKNYHIARVYKTLLYSMSRRLYRHPTTDSYTRSTTSII